MRANRSLRLRLTYWLIGPLLFLVASGSLVSYRIAFHAASQAYDSALLDPVLAIASHIRRLDDRIQLDLPSIAIEALRTDTEDRVYYQVLGPGDTLVAGTPRLPAPPQRLAPDQHIFYDTTLEDEPVRVAARATSVDGGTVIVQVAETLVKRNRLVLELLVASTITPLMIAVAAVALFWFGIARGLAPLEHLRDEIASRSPRDLRPVPEQDKPQEVQPLVGALNRLLSRLQDAIGAQQRFIANAAHQLRTPLSGLKTHAELARRQPSTIELRSLLDMISGETERTSHLVNQLLTLARAEPGESAATGQPVNLHEIIGRDLRNWVQRALKKNIDLGFELEDAWTLGEPLLLRELVANLLDNALAYTQDGGSVTVRTFGTAAQTVLEVEDDGPGIPPVEREMVFERFYRVSATGGDGCGLGLSIVAEIAERHAATVELAEPPGGKGTLMRTVFPRLSAGTLPAAAAAVRAG